VFELSTLSGIDVADVDTAIEAAQKLSRPIVVVTSVPVDEDLGTLLVAGEQALLATTPRIAAPPHGAGDLLTSVLFGHMVAGVAVDAALQRAVLSTYRILAASDGAPEMALIAEQAALVEPPAVAGFALTPIELRRRAHG
jgi:pyridoxal/pyridoxine/pyridoxamine kinase